MSLFLRCAICDRQQASGLLSGAGWKTVELPSGAAVDHPAAKNGTARVCPSCSGSNGDYEHAVLASLGLGGGLQATG